jgi:hypothetical protein
MNSLNLFPNLQSLTIKTYGCAVFYGKYLKFFTNLHTLKISAYMIDFHNKDNSGNISFNDHKDPSIFRELTLFMHNFQYKIGELTTNRRTSLIFLFVS